MYSRMYRNSIIHDMCDNFSFDTMHELYAIGFLISFTTLFLGNTGVSAYQSMMIEKPYGDLHAYHTLKNALIGSIVGAGWGIVKGIAYSIPHMFFWPYAILEHIYSDTKYLDNQEKLRVNDIRFHFTPGSSHFQECVREDNNLRDYVHDIELYKRLGIIKTRQLNRNQKYR